VHSLSQTGAIRGDLEQRKTAFVLRAGRVGRAYQGADERTVPPPPVAAMKDRAPQTRNLLTARL
jgi:hypothetical protein